MEMTRRVDQTGFGDLKIIQDSEAFCYGVDAVLLAGFTAEILQRTGKCPDRLMDLGTGNGIVPLILSHKTQIPALHGMEFQKANVCLAEESVRLNGLEGRIKLWHADVADVLADWRRKRVDDFSGSDRGLEDGIVQKGKPECACGKETDQNVGAVQEFIPEELRALKGCFDAVTSNPPYTKRQGGAVSTGSAKALARHETTADLSMFMELAALLLKEKGDLFMVHRPQRLVDLLVFGRKHRLEPKDMQLISGHEGEAPNLVLLHLVRGGGAELRVLPPFAIREPDGSYTARMMEIYEKEFREEE